LKFTHVPDTSTCSQKFNEKMARWREIQLRKKLEEPPYYGPEPPEIRRRIIVEDYDGGETTRHEIVLHRSNRIDCYRVEDDGKMLPGRKGWSSVLEMVARHLSVSGPFGNRTTSR
jgi:hypothetical protein